MRLLNHRVRSVQSDPGFWLLAVTFGLIALHLQVYWRLVGNFNHISLELIGWSAVFYCLWQRRDRLILHAGTGSQFVGWFLIALLLARYFNLQQANSTILEVTPFVIGFAIALIAVGFKQFRDYQRELWLVLVMAIPLDVLLQSIDRVINSSILTAKYSHALMWYSGFLVERKGSALMMPSGAVDVYLGCSGLEAAIVSLKVAVFFLLVFPIRRREKVIVPAIAVLSAFLINGFRIMLLADLVAKKDTAGFEFWHGDQGAQIFSMISMTIFSTYCQVLIEREQSEQNALESETVLNQAPEELERSSR